MDENADIARDYNRIAADYARLVSGTPLNKWAVYPSLHEAAGDVRGKDILDLATGAGTVAKGLKEHGAARVVGVDRNRGMLRFAKTENQKNKSGIEYVYGEVGALEKIGDFDVVTAGFLLHYAASKEELLHMCKDIAANLKPGGVFVAVNNNPLNPLTLNPKYENKSESIGPLEEGCLLQITYTIGETVIPFRQHYWKKETYEEALTAAGLVDVEWLPVQPSDIGRKEMGDDFFKDFQDDPFLVIIRARKPEKTV